MGIRHHVGLTRSADTFYAGHPRPGSFYAEETGQFDPDTQLEHSAESIERLALFGCELVRMLAENDQRRSG